MSDTSAVGALTIPVPAAAAGARLADPLLEGLLDFISFVIKDALDARLATIAPVGDPQLADALPAANRFTFDPMEPRGHRSGIPVPALFLFWLNDSKIVEWTTVKWYRRRELHLLYLFPEYPGFDQMAQRYGLIGAVDAALHKASRLQKLDGYTPPGGKAGELVSRAIGTVYGAVDWKWIGGRHGRFGIDEGPLAERRAAKRSGRDYPALKGHFEVMEWIRDPDVEPNGDIALQINAGAGEGGTEPFATRILPGPDGSEDQSQNG